MTFEENQELLEEELNELTGIEQIVLENNYMADGLIVIEAPMELKMILDKLENNVVAYDFLEYVLQSCTDLVRHKNGNYILDITEKVRFYISKYPSNIFGNIITYLDTLIHSLVFTCELFLKGLKKYGIDTYWYLVIINDRNLTEIDKILEIGTYTQYGVE